LIQLFETVNNFLSISQLNKIDNSKRYFVFHFKMLSYLYTIEEHVFAFSLAIEGNTENVLQFIVPFKSIHKENHSFLEQKNVFWMPLIALNNKKRFKSYYFCHENIF
jgi:hypothetical protein